MVAQAGFPRWPEEMELLNSDRGVFYHHDFKRKKKWQLRQQQPWCVQELMLLKPHCPKNQVRSEEDNRLLSLFYFFPAYLLSSCDLCGAFVLFAQSCFLIYIFSNSRWMWKLSWAVWSIWTGHKPPVMCEVKIKSKIPQQHVNVECNDILWIRLFSEV